MTPNLGNTDRIVRVLIGAALIAAPFLSGWAVFQSTAGVAVALIAGLVLIVTAAMRFCPLYRIFGLRTCRA